MKRVIRAKDLIIRGSYHAGRGGPRVKRKIDIEDADTMLDRKRELSPRKFYSMRSGCGCVNYNYIRRFFHAHVGQPFSDVYKKLCDKADGRSWAGQEWREAISRELEHPSPCEETDEGLFTLDGHRVCGLYNWKNVFYQDADGILREAQSRERLNQNKNKVKYVTKGQYISWPEYMRQNPNVRSVKMNKECFLIKSDGIWYEVTTRDLSGIEEHPEMHKLLIWATADHDKDVLLYDKCWKDFYKERIHNYRWETIIRKTYCGELRVAINKKPASEGVLQFFGVENSPYNEIDYECINWDTVAHNQEPGDESLMALFGLDE